ncbi:MAG TPA: hypothetical protein VMV25_13415 [Steroidobacteraceae bacterium]|nr:hypothetical protein [Steroidobacteraceae bacterium]
MSIPIHDEARFRRTQISRQDFTQAAVFVAAARKYSLDSIEYEALIIAAIIHYARPFSNNEKGKAPPSDPKVAPELMEFDDEQLKLHEHILALRNKAVAHAEYTNYPIDVSADGTSGGLEVTSYRWTVATERLDPFGFKCLADEMANRCALGVYEDIELRR